MKIHSDEDAKSYAGSDEQEVRNLRHRLDEVHERIAAAGADPNRVQIVAVTKGFGLSALRAALALGIADLGESYAQELVRKDQEIRRLVAGDTSDVCLPRWHFIGQLQSNKLRLLTPLVSMWHSIDRASIVTALARRAPGARVLIEVNVSGETQKGGCLPGELPALCAQARAMGLDVAGLMTVAPRGSEVEVRNCFRSIDELADAEGLVERSMGMSGDYEMAVQHGATMIRLGVALFGTRESP